MSSNKLSILVANERLLKETEIARAKAVKLELSTRKAGEFTPKKITDKPVTTSITQITVDSKDVRKAPSAGKVQSFKTSPSASKIVDQAPHLDFRGAGGGEPKKPKVSQGHSNQKAVLKVVSKPIKDGVTADDGSGKKSFIPAWGSKSASDVAFAMKAGQVSTDNNTPTIKKQKVPSLNATTSPKASRVSMTPKEELPTKKATKVGTVSGFTSDPSDAPKRSHSIAKSKTKVVNLVESGVEVRLGDKVKARFEIVSPAVIRRMVESHAKHGLKLDVVRCEAKWTKDQSLLNLLWESMDAQYNGVEDHYNRLRKEARSRFKTLVQGSWNELYESREDFLKIIEEAFRKVELNARKKYVEGLELMTCHARVVTASGRADLEMVTEAHTDQMALRQIINNLRENYGLNLTVEHIFVDGTKYVPEDIKAWTPTLSEKFSKTDAVPPSFEKRDEKKDRAYKRDADLKRKRKKENDED